MALFNGMMTVVVQSKEQPGKIVLEASAKGLPKAVLTLKGE